jgi:hypothetical protein
MIICIERIIKPRKLRNDDENRSDAKQNYANEKTLRRRAYFSLISEQVLKIKSHHMSEKNDKKENEEIADPHHPEAQRTYVTLVNMCKAVRQQKEHTGCFQ